jgi:hypothetical protein
LNYFESWFPAESREGRGDFAMKRKRFSVAQIAAVLKEAKEGAPVAELIRKAEISD